MSNRSDGTMFEKIFCGMLAERGFWAHNFAQTPAGQPADVIAVKGKTAWLIDCKVMSGDRFPLSRIEPNQLSAMAAWNAVSPCEPYFAVRLPDGAVYMLGYDLITDWICKDVCAVTEVTIRKEGIYFGAWLEGVNQLC